LNLNKKYLIEGLILALFLSLIYVVAFGNLYNLPDGYTREKHLGDPILSGPSGKIIYYEYQNLGSLSLSSLRMNYSLGEHSYSTEESLDDFQVYCKGKSEDFINKEAKANDTDLYFEFFLDCNAERGYDEIHQVKGVIKGQYVYWCEKTVWSYAEPHYKAECKVSGGNVTVNYSRGGFVWFEGPYVKFSMT
jgi:hypothetical protein